VLEAAAPCGLAPLSGSSPDVGVTGFTLGGGVSWLSRRHGFAADSLLRADVVLADVAIGGTRPVQFELFDELPDTVIAALVEAGRDATVEVRHWGGAMARPGAGAGPVGHRTVPLSVIVDRPLRDVKQIYDPENLFRYGHAIPPADAVRHRARVAYGA
jgi:FAD/FMN-containing dehydrogenase